MELVGFARGHIEGLQQWINLLSTAFWPHKAKDAEGKIYNCFSRTGISPIIPMSIIFPEKSRDFLLGMVMPQGNNKFVHILDENWKSKLLKNQMKKAFNLEDLPESWKKYNHPITDFMALQKVNFHAFGLRRDKIDKDGVEFL